MFHNRTLNNRISKLQERPLRSVYEVITSSFDELLEKENTFTIHQRNIQKLAIKMCKVKHKIAAKLMCELFQETEHPYDLRNDHTFRTYNVKIVQYRTETLSFMGPKI